MSIPEKKRLLFRLNNRAMSEAKRINPRNFPCDKCDMSYTTNQKLKFHKMSVHDGIKLNCPHCDVKLANPDTLQKHIKKQHEGSNNFLPTLARNSKWILPNFR